MIQGQTHIRTPAPWSIATEQCLHTPQVKWNIHIQLSHLTEVLPLHCTESRLNEGCPCWRRRYDVNVSCCPPAGAYGFSKLILKEWFQITIWGITSYFSLLSESDLFHFHFSWSLYEIKCVLASAEWTIIILLGPNGSIVCNILC